MNREQIIYKCLVGSQAYGTAVEGSDQDYKAIYCQGFNDLLGFGYKEQREVTKDETHYEVRRFLELCASNNPTMLEMLFMPDEHVLHTTGHWEIIRAKRHKFLTTPPMTIHL